MDDTPAQHPMRRRDRELSRAEAEAILRRGEYGILGTCGADGQPYAVPLSYVFDGASLAFHSATEGHKVENLRDNARACFTVVGATQVLPARFSTRYESAIAVGRVRPVSGERKRDILLALAAKYSPGFEAKAQAYARHDADKVAVFELEIERLSGKAHR